MSDIYEVDPNAAPQPRKSTRRRNKRKSAKRSAVQKPAAPVQTAAPVAPPVQRPAPPPSPAVLALQEQVVGLVGQRHDARQRLTASHAEYLAAQSKFQAAQAELQGIEQEVEYRITLIAQLENRAPQISVTQAAPVLQMPSLTGVTSEPSKPQANYAIGSADDMRRDIRGMM